MGRNGLCLVTKLCCASTSNLPSKVVFVLLGAESQLVRWEHRPALPLSPRSVTQGMPVTFIRVLCGGGTRAENSHPGQDSRTFSFQKCNVAVVLGAVSPTFPLLVPPAPPQPSKGVSQCVLNYDFYFFFLFNQKILFRGQTQICRTKYTFVKKKKFLFSK